MKELFHLPHKNWEMCKEILDWCVHTYGVRAYGGPWEYNAVHHDVVIYGEANIMLFRLRWS